MPSPPEGTLRGKSHKRSGKHQRKTKLKIKHRGRGSFLRSCSLYKPVPTPDKPPRLQEGVDSSGGYLVPVEYDARLIDILNEENIMRSLGTTISGAPPRT